MQPIKDKSLHYFILEEKPNVFSHSTGGFHKNKHILESLKKDDLDAIIDFFIPQHMMIIEPHSSFNNSSSCITKALTSQHFHTPFKVKYMEPVINCTGYQHSVRFTLGNARSINKEPEKYLVGIEIHLDYLDEQIKRIQENMPWYKLSFNDFTKIENIQGHRHYFRTFDSFGCKTYSFCFPKTFIDADIIGHAGNKTDVNHFSFDDNFKYYTLLCN